MITRIIAASLLLTLAAAGCAHLSTPNPLAQPPVARGVLIVSIDGLRPDLLIRADTPNLKALYRRGCFTFWARSTEVSITLPTHTSMLTGVVPNRHGIWWNGDLPVGEAYNPPVPTIFELARKAGYTTAMAAGKSKFVALEREGTLDWTYVPSGGAGDDSVAEAAARLIHDHRPQVLFVHFPGADAAGHGSGWGSPEQIKALESIDKAFGIVVDALRQEGLLDSTVIIQSADHGGQGLGHGADDVRSRHIPWAIAGPGIRQNVDLTQFTYLTVNVEDTFATACLILNLPLDEDLDGKPITQAFEDPPSAQPELLRPARRLPMYVGAPDESAPQAGDGQLQQP